MTESSIYTDIAKRTGGDIYIGVVGPVRSGKSTFIKKFLENSIIPNIENDYDRQRTIDEVPQSAAGRTIMTTEPKFVPDESVKIKVSGDTELNVKMIDCVGYMVDGALGAEEDGVSRMVMTPWSSEPMPFSRAAEIGTEKVIGEHSTIGVLVTTDGTISDIPRESYVPAEERVAAELISLGKPFAVVLNSKNPTSPEAIALAEELEKKYGAPTALVSCIELNREDIREILALILGEFPVRALNFAIPSWCEILEREHPVYQEIMERITDFSEKVESLGDIEPALSKGVGIERVSVNAGDGVADFDIPFSHEEFYNTARDLTGLEIYDERSLLSVLIELSAIKERYEKIEKALDEVEDKGYGIVMPRINELMLDEPTVIKQPGGWGVKVSANASSVHLVKSGIRADVCPVFSTEEQAREVVEYLAREYENCPEGIWECNMLGKSLYELVNDNMTSKLMHMPDESRKKLGETLEKIINEGANGLVCILL